MVAHVILNSGSLAVASRSRPCPSRPVSAWKPGSESLELRKVPYLDLQNTQNNCLFDALFWDKGHHCFGYFAGLGKSYVSSSSGSKGAAPKSWLELPYSLRLEAQKAQIGLGPSLRCLAFFEQFARTEGRTCLSCCWRLVGLLFGWWRARQSPCGCAR